MDILEFNSNFTLSTAINGPLLSAAIALIMVTAFVANLFVICITFCYSKSWKQPSTIFLTSLLFGNLVLVVFVWPFGIISTAYGEWIFGQSVEQKYQVCQFAAFIFWYSILLITVTLTVISLDRFLFIVKPLFYRRHIYMKPQIAVTVVIIVWIVCAILNTPPLYGLSKFHFSEVYGFCIPSLGSRSSEELVYSIYTLLLFSILFCCIIVTSIWTCCTTHGYLTRASERSSNEMENIYASKKRQFIGIFGALLLMNAITFAPYLLTSVLNIFMYAPPELRAISMVCGCLSTVGSPLVQVLFRQDIKTALKKLYSKIIAAKCHSINNTDIDEATNTVSSSSGAHSQTVMSTIT